MKPGSSLINAARGNIVDIDALVCALDSRHLSGAAIDVFPKEPKSNTDTFVSPLRGRDNVILTPTSAAAPRKPSTTSVWKYPASCSSTATTARLSGP